MCLQLLIKFHYRLKNENYNVYLRLVLLFHIYYIIYLEDLHRLCVFLYILLDIESFHFLFQTYQFLILLLRHFFHFQDFLGFLVFLDFVDFLLLLDFADFLGLLVLRDFQHFLDFQDFHLHLLALLQLPF